MYIFCGGSKAAQDADDDIHISELYDDLMANNSSSSPASSSPSPLHEKEGIGMGGDYGQPQQQRPQLSDCERAKHLPTYPGQ